MKVVDVQGEQFYLSLGARNHVLEGMRLDVFREGKELTSPPHWRGSGTVGS